MSKGRHRVSCPQKMRHKDFCLSYLVFLHASCVETRALYWHTSHSDVRTVLCHVTCAIEVFGSMVMEVAKLAIVISRVLSLQRKLANCNFGGINKSAGRPLGVGKEPRLFFFCYVRR